MPDASSPQSFSFRKVLGLALPVMLSYVAVGLACGVLSQRAGMDALGCFVLSATYLSGGGQFMIANLWLAGTPMDSLIISVCAISTRFALYSASLAPALKRFSKKESLAIAATFTEEAYGITLDQLTSKKDWSFKDALALDLVLMLTWATSVAAGAALGSLASIPTALASFAMTALFIYLLMGQVKGRVHLVIAAVSMGAVFLCKCAGIAGAAIPVAAVAGVASGLIAGEMMRK